MLENPAVLSIWIGIIAAVVAGAITHVLQWRKAAVFPAMPSRIKTVDQSTAAARYFAAAHDITNTITSAWNHARATNTDDTMLKQLERPLLGHHIKSFQEAAGILSEELRDHTRLNDALSSACRLLEASWRYDRHDHYRTETYYTTDAKGRRHAHTRQVYTHTSHSFSFFPDAASNAEREVLSTLASTKETDLYDAATAYLEVTPTEDDMIRVWETVYEGSDTKPTDKQVFDAMDAWNDAALAQHRIASAKQFVSELRRRATPGLFREIGRSRERYHYTTYGGPGSAHPGPAGYQATQALLMSAAGARNALTDLHSAMRSAEDHVSEIFRQWEEQGRFTDKDSGDLAESLLDHGIELYKALFPKSEITYDQRLRRGRTIGIAAGAGVVAGLISYALQVI